jgi:hypothetical protein
LRQRILISHPKVLAEGALPVAMFGMTPSLADGVAADAMLTWTVAVF